MVYAIVQVSGRQEKVSIGDYVNVNRLQGKPGDTVELPTVLIADGSQVKTSPQDLENVSVKAEIIEDLRGPKIVIQKYKNKTGYKKRQGHRQDLTTIKITDIN